MRQLGAIPSTVLAPSLRMGVGDIYRHGLALAFHHIPNGFTHGSDIGKPPHIPATRPPPPCPVEIQGAARVRLEITHRATCVEDSVEDQVNVCGPDVTG